MWLYRKSNTHHKRICFTFDDGPNPYATPLILDVLDEFKIKGVFFLVGANIKRFPEIVKQIYRRGHIIGNHSYSHSTLFYFYSAKAQRVQAQKVEDLLGGLGVRPCVYFRPPNALCSRRTLIGLSRYKVVGVNHWVGDNMIFSSPGISSRVLHSIKNRGSGILVLHDGVHPSISTSRKIIAESLKSIIPILLSKRYRFCSLDEIGGSGVIVPDNLTNYAHFRCGKSA